MPGLCGAGVSTQGPAHARQTLPTALPPGKVVLVFWEHHKDGSDLENDTLNDRKSGYLK